MQTPSIRRTRPRRRAIAGAVAALFALPFWAGAHAAAKAEAETESASAGNFGPVRYSVINLGPELTAAYLNERGQAAYTSFNYFGAVARFFDGDRVRPIGSLGGNFTLVQGLNNFGVVVGGSSTDAANSNVLAFAWTAGGGLRALPGASPSSALDINDRNQIVGWTPAPGVTVRAVRWNPDGSVTPLGPLPRTVSEARAINDRGYATGFVELAGNGQVHAFLWDRAGAPTDLGPTDGGRGFGLAINERNQVAGVIDYDPPGRTQGFFWSRDSGLVRIDAGPNFTFAGLNNRGEVVANADIGGAATAFQWSLGRGLVPLPRGAAPLSQVYDINDQGQMVGALQRPVSEGGDLRAVRWPSFAAPPIDLNTRLYPVPAGLVLRAAAAINEQGVILAESNAGLVMLRPGRRGTDAPLLGPIEGLPPAIVVGQEAALAINFLDNSPTQTHSASAYWADGCPSPAPTVVEAGGSGQVRLHHQFCVAGYYAVRVRVADSGGRATELEKDYIVDAPAVAALSGAGSLPAAGSAAAARAHRAAPLRFALWAPLGGAAAAGVPALNLSGPFHFRADQMTASSAVDGRARVEGTGRLDGRSGYRFVLEATDGGSGGADRLRVRITHADAATGADVLDYDNNATIADGSLTLRR
nr:hypothetical protein [uncultured Duganella sp.]